MDYYFQGYYFKSDQLVLLEKNKTVSLRANEAKLLALLISDANRVFSKEEILNSIWVDKVVAEQNVFQNISNLRAIFGDTAITTHPKKGYQWNIALESKPDTFAQSIIIKPLHNHWSKVVSAIASVVVVVAFMLTWLEAENSVKTLPHIAVSPTTFGDSDTNTDNNGFQQQALLTAYENSSLFKTSQLLLDQKSTQLSLTFEEKIAQSTLAEDSIDFILSSHFSTFNNILVLSFRLSSTDQTWYGKVSASSQHELIEKTQNHLDKLINSDYFSSVSTNQSHVYSQLQLLQQQYPDDINILRNFAAYAVSKKLIDAAILLVEDLHALAMKQKSQVFIVSVHRLKSRIYQAQKNYQRAQGELNKVQKIYQALHDTLGQAGILQQYASISWQLKNYPEYKQLMQESNELYLQDNKHTRVFHSLVSMAAIANKAKNHADRNAFIKQATQLRQTYGLSQLLDARLYFQQGLFAEKDKDLEKAVAFYRDVLALYTPEQNTWHKERSQYHLSRQLIRNKQYSDAVELFANEGELTAKEQVILAGVYFKWDKIKLATPIVKQAYRNSLLVNNVNTALDAALLLLELATIDEQLIAHQYKKYISENATPYFIAFNRTRLERLDLYAQLM